MLKGYNFDLAARFVSDYKLPVSVISDANVFEYELNLYEKEYQSLTKWNSLVENIEKYYDHGMSYFEVGNCIVNAYNKKNSDTAQLTVIIPFQNEGYEVEKTVTSVRGTAKDVKIMLIDDNSNDGYNYKKVAEIFGLL